jgi:hypothetical protein
MLACSDDDLLLLLNDCFPKGIHIEDEVWQRYLNDELREKERALRKYFDEWQLVIQRALIEQKVTMIEKLKEGASGWQRWNWLLERRFPEWGRMAPRKADEPQQDEEVKPNYRFKIVPFYGEEQPADEKDTLVRKPRKAKKKDSQGAAERAED